MRKAVVVAAARRHPRHRQLDHRVARALLATAASCCSNWHRSIRARSCRATTWRCASRRRTLHSAAATRATSADGYSSSRRRHPTASAAFRRFDDGAPLAPDECALRYRGAERAEVRDQRVLLSGRRGHALRAARYGEFRVAHDGDMILTGTARRCATPVVIPYCSHGAPQAASTMRGRSCGRARAAC